MVIYSSQNNWILNSSCSFHICVKNKLFDRYKPYDMSNVVMSNGLRSKINCVNTVKINIFDRVVSFYWADWKTWLLFFYKEQVYIGW